MATSNVPQADNGHSSNEGDQPPLSPAAYKPSQSDYVWEASCKAKQLTAMLRLCYGDGHEWFTCQSKDDQDRVLWLAGNLADDIDELLDAAQKAEVAA